MEKIDNPFIVAGAMPDKYFCDREKETQWITSMIANGHNLVLISPRRMGKTSLVRHCYQQPLLADSYHTFYIDILPTTSLAEFTSLLGKQIYDVLLPWGKKAVDKFISALSSLRSCLGYDSLSGLPTLTFSASKIADPVLTLEEIFRYLAEADKRCVVAIDEFQQISKYPEKNVEALLRSHIQAMSNCNFIFAGSERHMMMQMFQDSSRPFYNSTMMIDLRAIELDKYVDFIVRNFNEFGKAIDPADATSIYEMLEGNTYYIQLLCNAAFMATPKGGKCDEQVIEQALTRLLEINATFYRERLSLVPAKQKPLLMAIAKEGVCSGILSSDFIARHSLGTASAVQYAARQLVESGIVSLSDDRYSLSDKMLGIWMRRNLM